MPSAVRRRVVCGVSTREYEQVIDTARDGFGVAKSSVSREFVRASTAKVKALSERSFNGQRFPVVMTDGVEYADETMVVAMGITEDGTKRSLGLRQARLRTQQFARSYWKTCKNGDWTRPSRRSWCSTVPSAP